MRFRLFLWTGLFSCLVPALALGQAPGQAGGYSESFPGQAGGYPGAYPTRKLESPERMYEDIEIMRRIVDRKLTELSTRQCMVCHMQTQGMAFSPKGDMFFGIRSRELSPNTGSTPLARGNGVYLPGQGVIYQGHLPTTLLDLGKAPKASKIKTISAWEQVRNELHGKRQTNTKVDPHQIDLDGTILQILVENGKHFSELAPQETITVAIAFTNTPSHSTSSGMGSMGGMPGMSGTGMGGAGGIGGASMGSPGFPGMGSGGMEEGGIFESAGKPGRIGGSFKNSNSGGGLGGPGEGTGGLPGPGGLGAGGSATSDFELLGDMSLKQNKINKAIEAYQLGLKHYNDQTRKNGLLRKLAAAHAQLLLEKSTSPQAQKDAIEEAIRALKKVAELQQTPKTTAKNVALAPRLIITVSKKTLAEAAEGKISMANLRKQSVTWVRFFKVSPDSSSTPGAQPGSPGVGAPEGGGQSSSTPPGGLPGTPAAGSSPFGGGQSSSTPPGGQSGSPAAGSSPFGGGGIPGGTGLFPGKQRTK